MSLIKLNWSTKKYFGRKIHGNESIETSISFNLEIVGGYELNTYLISVENMCSIHRIASFIYILDQSDTNFIEV